MIDRILRMFGGLFIGILVARYLGPTDFGLLNYSISFVFLFSLVITLGINDIATKELINKENKENVILGTSFFIMLLGLVTFFILITTFNYLITTDKNSQLIIFILMFSMIFKPFDFIVILFQSKIKNNYLVIVNSISFILISILKIILIIREDSLTAFVILVVLESFLNFLGYIYIYKKYSNVKDKLKVNFNLAKEILRKSFPLLLSAASISLYLNTDKVMLGYLLGNIEVGYYSAGIRAVEAYLFFPIIIMTIMFPILTQSKKTEKDETFLLKLKVLYSSMIYLAIFFAVIICIFSEKIILLLYGKEYILSAQVLSLYSIVAIFIFLANVNSKWYVLVNKQKHIFYRTCIGAILNIIFNYILIPIYGINGAVYGTGIGYIFGLFLSMFVFKETRENFYLSLRSFNPIYLFKLKVLFNEK